MATYGSADLHDGSSRPNTLDNSQSYQKQKEEEDALRRKLKYFFMSPCDKYHAKGRKPFKLGLQLLKIIIVTVQVSVADLDVHCYWCRHSVTDKVTPCCHPGALFLQLVLFGLSNQMVVTFKEENTATFNHLFLKGYGDNSGHAVHTQKELYDQIQFTIEQVYRRSSVEISLYLYLERQQQLQPACVTAPHEHLLPAVWTPTFCDVCGKY